MAAVLIISESNLMVLAEEGTLSAETQEDGITGEVSVEEAEDVDVDKTDEADDIGGADNVDDTDNPDDEDELPNEDDVDKNICICESKCSADMVNENCPACARSYVNCIGMESEETEEEELPEDLENGAVTKAVEDEGIEVYAGVDLNGMTFYDEQGIKYRLQIESAYSGGYKAAWVTSNQNVGGDTLHIPAKITSPNGNEYNVVMDDYTFQDCQSLVRVYIEDGVSLAYDAFSGCTNLTYVRLPEDSKKILGRMFQNCTSLQSIELPKSVEAIEQMAFAGCSSLNSISLPDNLRFIYDRAFEECIALENIEIPDSVTLIDQKAFIRCTGLESVKLPSTLTKINELTFYECTGLSSIKMPDTLQKISKHAFYKCENLESIEIPQSVTSIEQYAFAYCKKLKEITIPDGVTQIEGSTFEHCENLETVTMPDSVTSIGGSAFYCCYNLTDIGDLNNVREIQRYAFLSCKNLESISINNVEIIADQAFRFCSKLNDIGALNKIKNIGSNAFSVCESLESITMADSINNIGEGAFSPCSNLASIKIPDSLTSIGEGAFWNCENLRTLYIVISSDETDISVPEVILDKKWKVSPFYWTPDDRDIIFVSEDGLMLAGSALEAAKAAYKADVRDGNNKDNLWWGWKLGESDDSEITINVRKDNSDWTDHTRKFALQPAANPDAALITDFTSVADGQYKVYDITGGADSTSRIDTKETITVSNGAGEATVDYYTVTFYDGDTAYAADTLQTVLKGKKATKPTDPVKTGHQFNGWVTEKDGSISFDFENSTIGGKTNIYADWTADTYNITYHLDDYTASQEDSIYTYGGRKLPMPVRAGYVFDGWYENENYSSDKIDSIGSTESGDKIYYGQWIKQTAPSYRVNVTVKKDDGDWEKHGRVFMLFNKNDSSRTSTFDKVNQGEYFIYDVTGVASEDLSTKGVNTNISVVVTDEDVNVTVDYYTVTFYDGSTAYEAEPWVQQIVLKGKTAVKPAKDPEKTGCLFLRWVTTDGGSETFNFDVSIAKESYVYADWVQETATKYVIEASAEEGGRIFPEGNVSVQEGGSQIFEMTPDDGYRIKSVIVDGIDRTEEITDSTRVRAVRAQAATSRYYTFSDVRENHTITVLFETESSGDDSGNTGTGGNTGDGSGNTGTGGNGGDDSSTPTGGNDGGSAGDNSDNTDGSYLINISNTDGSNTNRSAERTANGNNGGNSNSNSAGNSSKDAEPKTGDSFHVEIYATVAMIAGLTYLLLYFADKEKGMTEEKKQEIVSAMIRWAKRGRRIRKYVVLVPIFILLCYYHSIGKRIEVDWEEEPVWAEL